MNFKWNGFKFASEFQINSVHHNHSNFVGLHFKFCKIFLWGKCIDTFHIFTIFQFIRVSIYMRKWKKNSFSSFCDIKEWGQRGGTGWEIEIEIMEFVKLKYLNIHGSLPFVLITFQQTICGSRGWLGNARTHWTGFWCERRAWSCSIPLTPLYFMPVPGLMLLVAWTPAMLWDFFFVHPAADCLRIEFFK